MRKGDINMQETALNENLNGFFNEWRTVYHVTDLSQNLLYFLKICTNCDIKFAFPTIIEALHKCKDSKCKELLNQYIKKELF